MLVAMSDAQVKGMRKAVYGYSSRNPTEGVTSDMKFTSLDVPCDLY